MDQIAGGEQLKEDSRKYYVGCIVGGAIGDALGWPVEFMGIEDIKNKFGDLGICDLVTELDGKAQITDDTQMTMFTTEGLLRANSRLRDKGICHAPTVLYFAYQRWLNTQGYSQKDGLDWIYDGWLLDLKRLHATRSPGNSFISALLGERKGTINSPINNSKGCGAVMRSAPFGLFLREDAIPEVVTESAALTHGHPIGQIAAVAFSYIIFEIINGQNIHNAVVRTIKKINKLKKADECIRKLEQAIRLSTSNVDDIESIAELGEGWIAEEALAIGVFCALRYKNDFKVALITAVNHNGDSDSTGSITGNILGVYLGIDRIPEDWINKTELIDEIRELANDLYNAKSGGFKESRKYPGY